MPHVVLPVLNEADAIPWVLERMPAGYEPIVVDNGSIDGSGEIARRLGAQVVREDQPGFGAACFAGLMAATHEIVCFMDCDASLHPGELPSLAVAIEQGTSDLVLGARQPTSRAAWPAHARLANAVLARKLRRSAHVNVRDLGPMRAARRQGLINLAIQDRRFGWPLEMVLLAARAGWTISELPVAYHPRIGRSKVTGTVRGTVRAVRDMSAVLS